MKLIEVHDDFMYFVKPFQYLIHASIRDEALGDFWELHHARTSQGNKLVACLVSVIQFCSLIGYSFQLTVEESIHALIEALAPAAQSFLGVLLGFLATRALKRAKERLDSLRQKPLKPQEENLPLAESTGSPLNQFTNENLEELLSDFCEVYADYYGQPPEKLKMNIALEIIRDLISITVVYSKMTVEEALSPKEETIKKAQIED